MNEFTAIEDIEAQEEADKGDQALEAEEEEEIEPAKYEVITYPSDPTLEVIWKQWQRGNIYIPEFQRSFVWNKNQCSSLIESLLFGLPVPPVFLFIDSENRNIIVDGQQRIKTITSFFEGVFPVNPNQKHGKVEEELEMSEEDRSNKSNEFRLAFGKYSGKTYSELPTDIKLKFDQTVLRATNIYPKQPEYKELCMYEIFTRLNKGSSKLTAQEMRNCVWNAEGFIRILKDLNEDKNWRKIYGSDTLDKRQRDVEMILRIFALHGEGRNNYSPSLKKFLDDALIENKSGETDKVKEFVLEFKKCAELIFDNFGELPCHFSNIEGRRGRLNVQVLEALFCVLIDKKGDIPPYSSSKYSRYRMKYRNSLPTRSTDTPANVQERYKRLFDNIILDAS